MRPSHLLAAALASAALSGCVLVHSSVPVTAKPAQGSGYVSGLFARGEGNEVGLELRNVDTGRVDVLPFDRGPRAPGDTSAHAVMLELRPGTYRITSWVTFDAVVHSLAGRKHVPPDDPLGAPFAVPAGGVVLVGSLAAAEARDYPMIRWAIGHRRIALAEAAAELRRAFPGFAEAPVTCLLCDAPEAPAKRLDAATPPPFVPTPAR